MIQDVHGFTLARTRQALPLQELGTILIVEDDPRMQRVLQRMFSAEQYEVATAADGQSALDLFHSRKPLAVVLDLVFRVLEGRRLCQVRTSPETPVAGCQRNFRSGGQGASSGAWRR